jgi:hypothetical protein
MTRTTNTELEKKSTMALALIVEDGKLPRNGIYIHSADHHHLREANKRVTPQRQWSSLAWGDLDRLATAVIVFGERGGSFPVSIAAFTSRGMHSLHRMAHGDGRRDRLVSRHVA